MNSSMGVFSALLHVITLFIILISSLYADDSPALPNPENCFKRTTLATCGLPMEYPLQDVNVSSNSCGYPGFEVACNPLMYGEKTFINISNSIYRVIRIDYKNKSISLVDIGVDGISCPQPKRNFSFPSSPPWVNYHISIKRNITIFSNCSSNRPADANDHLLCGDGNNSSTSSYAFYSDKITNASYWYGNCAENVVVPVTQDLPDYNPRVVMNLGFYMGWSATDWCEDCERSGGQCWSSSLNNSTGCACQNNKSYNRTCPPDWCEDCELSGGQCSLSTIRKSPGCACKYGKFYDRTCPPPQPGKQIGLKIIIGVVAGIGGLLLLVVLLVCVRKKTWRNNKKSPIDVKAFLDNYGSLALQRYTYSGIKKMTNSFKDKLGEGGYGQVFKGKFRDGRLVAVKVLNESKGDGEDFVNEFATISKTNHVNVVTLLGFCIEGTKRALVYEFMPNGSLERFIYTHKEPTTIPPLGWEKLYEIALGIARGLEYLHRGCNTRILHFDIKPHNILLDQDFCPKISDFGLAKLYPTRESVVSTVGARGTMGYIAPELYYRNFGGVSHKSDVYSYGMMMLEMIGGRKNIDATVENTSEIYYPFWIYNQLMQNTSIAKDFKDIHAREEFEDEKAKKMSIVALWCIQAHPMERPSISKVVEMLEGNIRELQMPPNPSLDPRCSSSTSS